jgi:hypothetical protein
MFTWAFQFQRVFLVQCLLAFSHYQESFNDKYVFKRP